MGVATFLIGLLPTYDVLGPWAAVLLLVLRIAQGFGVGGEWGGAVLMAVEHAPASQRGYYGAWPQMGVPAGLLISTAVFAYFASLPEPAFLSWGWRVPFLLSGLLVIVGLVIRAKIAETPSFAKVKSEAREERQPILEVLKRYPREVVLAMGARFAENGSFYIYSVFVLTYGTQHVRMDRQSILNGILLASALQLVALPIYGALSDRLGRRPVYLFGAAMTVLWAYPFFVLVDTGSTMYVWIALVVGFVVAHSPMYGPQGAFLSELFGTSVRYSGASLGAQLSAVIAGGTSPLIATWLLAEFAAPRAALSIYLAVMGIVTLVAVFVASETRHYDIS
jgi:MFS family permease